MIRCLHGHEARKATQEAAACEKDTEQHVREAKIPNTSVSHQEDIGRRPLGLRSGVHAGYFKRTPESSLEDDVGSNYKE